MTAFAIRGDEIDYELARGGESDETQTHTAKRPGPCLTRRSHVSSFGEVLTDRRIVIFTASAVLFNFANAAMLPLVGERISVGKPQSSSLLMSACIIVAQFVMVPVAAAAGRLTEMWGRKSILLIGFMSLPIRGVLFTLSDQPSFVIAVQILDGLGAALFGVLSVLVVADLTKGTGHFNLAQGAIATATGIGASLSLILAGLIVEYAGYQVAFLSLAAVATFALLIFWTLMPETEGVCDSSQRSGNGLNKDLVTTCSSACSNSVLQLHAGPAACSERTRISRFSTSPVATTRCPTYFRAVNGSARSISSIGADRFLKKPERQLRAFGTLAPSVSVKRKRSSSTLTSRQPVMLTGVRPRSAGRR